MKHFDITYGQCENSGVNGLFLQGVPYWVNYDACAEGALLAHDILEHDGLDAIGGLGNELEAIGAAWFIRGQFGYFRKSSTAATSYDGMRSDLTYFAENFTYNGQEFDLDIPSPKGYCEAKEDFDDIITTAKEEFFRHGNMDSIMEPDERKRANNYFKNVYAFLKSGYNKAKSRYRRIGGEYAVNSLFWKIADEADNILKWSDYEGQQWKLSIDFKNGRVFSEEIFEEFN